MARRIASSLSADHEYLLLDEDFRLVPPTRGQSFRQADDVEMPMASRNIVARRTTQTGPERMDLENVTTPSGRSTILFRATWEVAADRLAGTLVSIRRLLEPTRTEEGCVNCQAYVGIENSCVIVYLEEWTDESSLAAHLRSDSLKVLLSLMELGVAAPDVQFHVITNSRGLEAIAEARRESARH